MKRWLKFSLVALPLVVVALALLRKPDAPATIAAPIEQEASHDFTDTTVMPTSNRSIASESQTTQAAELLKEGLEAAKLADRGDRSAIDRFLQKLDMDPESAKKMIAEGLSTLPLTSSIERAGLLDLVPRYADSNRDWAVDVLEKELVEHPSPPRIRRADAKTREDRDAAISVTPDILRTHLATENLIGLLRRDCGQLSSVAKKILDKQKDEILRENFVSRVNFECPGLQLAAHAVGDQNEN